MVNIETRVVRVKNDEVIDVKTNEIYTLQDVPIKIHKTKALRNRRNSNYKAIATIVDIFDANDDIKARHIFLLAFIPRYVLDIRYNFYKKEYEPVIEPTKRLTNQEQEKLKKVMYFVSKMDDAIRHTYTTLPVEA